MNLAHRDVAGDQGALVALGGHHHEQTLTGFQLDPLANRKDELAHGHLSGHQELVLGDVREITSPFFDDDRYPVRILLRNLESLGLTVF